MNPHPRLTLPVKSDNAKTDAKPATQPDAADAKPAARPRKPPFDSASLIREFAFPDGRKISNSPAQCLLGGAVEGRSGTRNTRGRERWRKARAVDGHLRRFCGVVEGIKRPFGAHVSAAAVNNARAQDVNFL